MKQTINFNRFVESFRIMGRGNQFSYSGLRALFDYLEEYENETGMEIELDVIALCCDFTELDEQEAREQYDLTSEDWKQELADETVLIDVDDSRVVIQQY